MLAGLPTDPSSALSAIASGTQPSAAIHLAARYTSNVPPADPSAPPLNDAWKTIGGFLGVELDTTDDLFRFFPDTAKFLNSFFDSAQGVYKTLNPSAATELPANYPAQDYGRVFDHTKAAGVGVVGIRVLAGGALSGSSERHPIAGPAPEPIGSAMSYAADIDRARRLMPLVKEGFASSLAEAATRFALSHPAMGTILVGMATPEQFEEALAAVLKGPLPQAALDRRSALRQAF